MDAESQGRHGVAVVISDAVGAGAEATAPALTAVRVSYADADLVGSCHILDTISERVSLAADLETAASGCGVCGLGGLCLCSGRDL